MLHKEKGAISTGKTQGRSSNPAMQKWFEKLCQWLESEAGAELFTLSELHSKMVEFAGKSEVYTIRRLKQKLQEHYKEYAFFAEIKGRSNVLCFKNIVEYIINEKWYSEKKASIEDEAKGIVAAAKIINAEMRGKKYDSESYPTNEDICKNDHGKQWIPSHLQTFLETIIASELNIGHAMVQSSRTGVINSNTIWLRC